MKKNIGLLALFVSLSATAYGIDSVSAFGVGEKCTLRQGSWMFIDEQAHNEFLAVANDPKKISDLQASGRINRASRDYTVFLAATDGFAGFVQVRTRRNDHSRVLFWTPAENIVPLLPPKDFLIERADLPKGAFFYRSFDQLRAFKKADSEDNEKEAMRIGKQLETDRLLQRTRVRVLERADDPYYYKVEMTLPNRSRVRGWARARDLELVPEDAEQLADGRIRQFQKFRLGDFTYEIKRCELRARLGSEFLSYTKPGAGAVFVLVRFVIANETKKTATVLADDFTLRDAQGREFRPASNALTALLMEGENKDFLITEIQPGVEKESITAFEVPRTSLTGDLMLIVPEKGFAGSKTVEVLIKPQTR